MNVLDVLKDIFSSRTPQDAKNFEMAKTFWKYDGLNYLF